jgi:uncharacterized protein YfaP (DUF2135 family)
MRSIPVLRYFENETGIVSALSSWTIQKCRGERKRQRVNFPLASVNEEGAQSRGQIVSRSVPFSQ